MTPAEIDALLAEPMARAMAPVAWQAHDAGSGMITEYRVQRIASLQAVSAALAAQRITLKSAGLFIAPEVATEEMLEAVKPFPAHLVSADPSDPKHVAMRAATIADQLSVKTLWSDLVTEWQRGGAA